jgi:hypothetical protein
LNISEPKQYLESYSSTDEVPGKIWDWTNNLQNTSSNIECGMILALDISIELEIISSTVPLRCRKWEIDIFICSLREIWWRKEGWDPKQGFTRSRFPAVRENRTHGRDSQSTIESSKAADLPQS